MNGLINMSRIMAVSVSQRDDKHYLVFMSGRKNYAMEVESLKDGEELLNFIMRKKPAYFRVKAPVVNIDKQ